jgi:hypothetical protein
MNKESVEDLRFDRRLRHRAGWIQDSALEDYLASLPDVSEKMTTSAEEETVEEEVAPAPEAPVAPVPTAGDFSTPSSFGGFGDESGGN